MFHLKKKITGVILGAMCFASYAGVVYPSSIKIKNFQTDRAIYKPGKPVNFLVEFTAKGNHQDNSDKNLDIQIWVERALEKPFLATSKKVASTGKTQKIKIEWLWADKNVFGHRAWVRFVDERGRLIAEKDTFFDIAKNWINVMRMVCIGTKNLTSPEYPDANIEERISQMRSAYLNALEMFTFSPKPYVLAPKENKWLYQYQYKKPAPRFYISKERLQAWGRALHKNGMKYVAYNETSAAEGPEDWQTYQTWLDNGKTPYAHYFKDKGMFAPNSIKIADLFAKEMANSVKMFGWDGVLMDSAIACHIRTAEGMDKNGKQLTDLTVGEVGYKHLEEARKLTKAINPDFCFLSQNATSITHNGVKLEPAKMYPWIKANAERMKIKKYSELVDLYTLEIDSHHEPRDGRYPLTYEKMSLALNSVVEVTGRPLMSWAYIVTPFYDEYSVAFSRPYMALIFASRTKLNDHFAGYGGAWSDGSESPASEQFIKYNRFMARFSYYLWDPKLKWKYDPGNDFSVSASRPLFWDKLVYERKLDNGKKQTVINLLNLPSNGTILGQKEIPPLAQNVTLKIRNNRSISRVVIINADSDTLEPVTLLKDRDEGNCSVYRVPPVTCWSLVIIESM